VSQRIVTPDSKAIEAAAALVRAGHLVGFPTETVYGLAADASNPAAMARLNRVKGRPPEKPYSLHVASALDAQTAVRDVSPPARRLMERFWPGPLTLVLPAKGGGTIGVRVPDHPVAQAFLRACAVPVVAPSANRAGQPPPRDAQAVLRGLDGDVDLILDAGPTPLGCESTVVDLSRAAPVIVREGAIAAQEVYAALAIA
jgi:L-threonylcarbamoyladenylate synthase